MVRYDNAAWPVEADDPRGLGRVREAFDPRPHWRGQGKGESPWRPHGQACEADAAPAPRGHRSPRRWRSADGYRAHLRREPHHHRPVDGSAFGLIAPMPSRKIVTGPVL